MSTEVPWTVAAVHPGKRLALRSDEVVGKVTTLIDEDGKDTDDANEAVSLVIEWPDGLFSSVSAKDFTFAGPDANVN